MSEQQNLLPCPFCGGEPELKQTGRKEMTIKCKSCLMGLKQCYLKFDLEWLNNKLVESWNKRALKCSCGREAKIIKCSICM